MSKKVHVDCVHCDSRKDSLLCSLSEEELKKLGTAKTCNTYKKGQIIFHEGNRPLGLFCLQTGKVKIYKTGINGKEQIVRMGKPGDFLGYRALVGEEFYSASAAAIEDCSICLIDKEVFFSVLQTNQELSWNLTKFLCHELRAAEDYMTDMAQKSVRERLAEVLLILKQKYGYDEADSTLLNSTLTREELASFVGTATETLIRLLSDMKKENVIELQGRKIKILNEQKLSDIANLEY